MEGQNTGMAIASLVLGILSLVLSFFGIGFILGIVAVVLGHIQKSNIAKNPEVYGGSGLALGGLITGYIAIGFAVLSLFLFTGLLALFGIGLAASY